ncbi:MAG: EAL domain-containing protein [Novosphingobium sp.]|nr:EAL domain-containing protein [Novosphingobium sp.]
MITESTVGTGPRILVVDDNPANVDLLVRRLARDGYCVHSLYTAVDLENEVDRIDPDLVLLDWMMPDRSGLDALVGLRTVRDSNRLPVIMVTALGEGDSVALAIEAGANDYVTKPIDFPVLRSRLNGALVRRMGVLEADTQNVELEAVVAKRTADLQRANTRLQSEVAERVKAESRANRLARTDALTQLPNRLHFTERLKTLSGRSSAEFEPFSLIQVDIDRFRAINGVHGTQTGDAVLCEVAKRIQTAMPSGELIARTAADEFSVLLPASAGSGPDAGLKIRGALADAFDIGGRRIVVSTAIAVTHSGPVPCDGDELLLECDAALQHVKQAGGGGLCQFDERMELAVRANLALKRELTDGLARKEFVPFFQPIVDFSTGEVSGAEVLARWRNPTRGTLNAAEFVQAVEETGLVDELFWAILPSACAQALKASPTATVAVNLSPSQVLDQWFPQKVLKVLTETGFPAARLEIEMTETALFSDIKATKIALEGLRAQGVHIALDDFGVGYSSLSLLRELPISKVKIDRSFVSGILTDVAAAAMVRGIIDLCQTLGFQTTAEGIEEAAVARQLAEWGCTFGQGYWLGMPAADLVLTSPWLQHANRKVA